jgi:ketol-acid reductoisomerase
LANESIASVYSLEDFTNSEAKVMWMKYLTQLALALGSHAPPFPVTMKEETDADLLSEQTLLCGFYPYMIEKVFKYMVSKGISKELAYYECFEESFLILKALRDLGPEHFFNMISPNALIGSYDAHQNLPHKELDAFIDNQWNKIQSGHFQKYCEGNSAFEDMKSKTMQHWQTSPLAKTFNQIKGQSK